MIPNVPLYFSIDSFLEYMPGSEDEIDAKTMKYIRIGELVRENVTTDSQLIVLWVVPSTSSINLSNYSPGDE